MKHLLLAALWCLFASPRLGTAWLTLEQQDELLRHLPANEATFGTAIKTRLIIEKARVIALNRLGEAFLAFEDANAIEQMKEYGQKKEEHFASKLEKIKQEGEQKKADLAAKWLVLDKERKMEAIDKKVEEELGQLKPLDFFERMIALDKGCIEYLETLTRWAQQLNANPHRDLEGELAKWEKANSHHEAILHAAERFGFPMPEQPEGHLYEVREFEQALNKFRAEKHHN